MQANRADPDQTPHFVVSDLGLPYLPLSYEFQKFGEYIVEIIFLVKVHQEHLT